MCYEVIFGGLVRDGVTAGSQLLTTVTNDAWYGRSSAPFQHFDQAALRAIEQGRYLVRAAYTGVSGVIDPVGRVRKTTSLFERVAIVDEVGLRQGPLTFYGVYGDFFAWGCILATGVFLVLRKRRVN